MTESINFENPSTGVGNNKSGRAYERFDWEHKDFHLTKALRAIHGPSTGRVASWIEHEERQPREDGGWYWIAHPYRLSDSDLQGLIILREYGYEYSISPVSAYRPDAFEVRVSRVTEAKRGELIEELENGLGNSTSREKDKERIRILKLKR